MGEDDGGQENYMLLRSVFFVFLLRSSSLLMTKLGRWIVILVFFSADIFISRSTSIFILFCCFTPLLSSSLSIQFSHYIFFPRSTWEWYTLSTPPCVHVYEWRRREWNAQYTKKNFFLKESEKSQNFPPRTGNTQQSMGWWRQKIISDDNNSLENGDFKVEKSGETRIKINLIKIIRRTLKVSLRLLIFQLAYNDCWIFSQFFRTKKFVRTRQCFTELGRRLSWVRFLLPRIALKLTFFLLSSLLFLSVCWLWLTALCRYNFHLIIDWGRSSCVWLVQKKVYRKRNLVSGRDFISFLLSDCCLRLLSFGLSQQDAYEQLWNYTRSI